MERVYRFLEYRKALWFRNDWTLETLLREAIAAAPLSGDRLVQRTDGSTDMAARVSDFGREGIAIHCVRYVDQQPAGIVPMISQETTRLSERPPGNDENFLNRDYAAFIFQDHVVTANAGTNAASLRNFLVGLFEAARFDEDASRFDLVRRASADQLQKIEASGGVEKVQLDLSIEDATLAAVRDRQAQRTARGWSKSRMVAPLVRLIEDLAMSDRKAAQLESSQKGKFRLQISVPKGDLVQAKSGIDGVAEILVEDDDADDYVIYLRNGDQIRPSELAVRKRVRVTRYANTIDTDEVLGELRTFMADLRGSRQLEM